MRTTTNCFPGRRGHTGPRTAHRHPPTPWACQVHHGAGIRRGTGWPPIRTPKTHRRTRQRPGHTVWPTPAPRSRGLGLCSPGPQWARRDGSGGRTACGSPGKGPAWGGASSPGPPRKAGNGGEPFLSTRRTDLGPGYWAAMERTRPQARGCGQILGAEASTLRSQAGSEGRETDRPRREASVLRT